MSSANSGQPARRVSKTGDCPSSSVPAAGLQQPHGRASPYARQGNFPVTSCPIAAQLREAPDPPSASPFGLQSRFASRSPRAVAPPSGGTALGGAVRHRVGTDAAAAASTAVSSHAAARGGAHTEPRDGRLEEMASSLGTTQPAFVFLG